LASEVKAALHDATAEAGWLPPERRRADHQRYARHESRITIHQQSIK